MDIIIAGAGGVGFRLARTLCLKHNVTVLDKNEDALSRLQESIDILAIVGNIENPKTYELLVDKESDLFIAVTDSDEANIISTLIAEETINVKEKIIRLRNDFFAKSTIGEKLGITSSVFPFAWTAKSIESLLEFPKANNVKGFQDFSQKLISVRVEMAISTEEINSAFVKVVGIERDKNFFIPSDYETLQKDDLIYLIGDIKNIKEICSRLNPQMPTDIKNIVIFGAELLGIEIAKLLSNYDNVSIKLIEKNLKKCEDASEILQENVAVINSKYGEHQLFKEENLENADMLIASTSNDEFGIKKVVAVNNDLEHYGLMHKLDIIAVRGPKTNAYYSILEKINSSTIVSQRQYCGGKGLLLLRKILNDSILLESTIKPYKKENAGVFIVKGDKIQDFNEPKKVEVGDIVVIFGKCEDEEDLKKWINSL